MLNILLTISVPIVLGYIVQKYKKLDLKVFSEAYLYIFNPALAFYAVYSYQDLFSITVLKFLSIMLVITIIFHYTIFFVSKIFHLSKSTRVALSLCAVMGNTAGVGLNLAQTIKGESAFALVGVYVGLFGLFMYVYGPFMAASVVESNFKQVFKNVMHLPVLYAMFIAAVLNFYHIPVPSFLLDNFKHFGMTGATILIIQLGMSLAALSFKYLKENWKLVLFVNILKLLVMPFLFLFLLKIANIPQMEYDIITLLACSPVGAYGLALTIHFSGDEKLVESSIFVSVFLMLLTIPLVLYFM